MYELSSLVRENLTSLRRLFGYQSRKEKSRDRQAHNQNTLTRNPSQAINQKGGASVIKSGILSLNIQMMGLAERLGMQ